MEKRKKKSTGINYYIGFMPIIFSFLLITNIILLVYSPGGSSFIIPNEHRYDNYKPLPTMPVEELKEHLNLYIYKTVNGELLTEYIDDAEYNKVYRVTCSKKCYFSTYKEPFNLSNEYVVIEEGGSTNIYNYIDNKLVKSFIGVNAIFIEENLLLEHSNSYALFSLTENKYITEYIYDSIKVNPFYNNERKINVFTNHLVASQNGKYGIVNAKNGYEVTKFIYDDVTCYDSSNYEYCKCKGNNTYDVYTYNKFNTSISKLSNSYKDLYPIVNDKYAYGIVNNNLVLINLPVESVVADFGVVDYNTMLYTSVRRNNPYIKLKKTVGRNTECIEYMYDVNTKEKKINTVSCD